MTYTEEFRRCLVELDVVAIRYLYSQALPHLPRIKDDKEALTTLHYARTAAESVPDHLRQYSHRWLTDRGLPSQLPDNLKPLFEQAVPRIVDGVGISVRSEFPEVATRISTVMRDAVLEAYSDNMRNPQFVRQRMQSARMRERKALGLRRIQE